MFWLINMSRPNIGKSTVHRLLLQSAPGGRVSESAAEEAQKAVVEYLEKAGQAAAEHLAIAKRKTVNKDIAEKVLSNTCMGVTKSALKYTQGEQRGLAVAGCVRHCLRPRQPADSSARWWRAHHHRKES